MFCEKCGAKLDDSAMFCESCGAKVGAAEAPEDEVFAQPEEPKAAPKPPEPKPVQNPNVLYIPDERKFTDHKYNKIGGFLSFSKNTWIALGILRCFNYLLVGLLILGTCSALGSTMSSLSAQASSAGNMLDSFTGGLFGSSQINSAKSAAESLYYFFFTFGLVLSIQGVVAVVFCSMLAHKIRKRNTTFVTTYIIYVFVSVALMLILAIYALSVLGSFRSSLSDITSFIGDIPFIGDSASGMLSGLGGNIFGSLYSTIFMLNAFIFLTIAATGFLRIYYFAKSTRVRTYMGTDLYIKRNPITRPFFVPNSLGKNLSEQDNAEILTKVKLKPMKINIQPKVATATPVAGA